MIHYLQGKDKNRCRDLWEEAFPDDSQAFCDYYFQEKMKDNRVMVREESGVIQAMLHLNPYRLFVNGMKCRIDYIVGVATKAECRRRGYMRQLLTKMFRELNEEEMPFVFLMPAAKEIYLPYDFVYIFDQPEWRLKESEEIVHQTVYPVTERAGGPGPAAAGRRAISRGEVLQTDGFGWRKRMAEAAGWINGWLGRHYQVYAIRDEAYIERLGKELVSEGGRMELLYQGGRMVGVTASWGLHKPSQRLLYCEDRYRYETDLKPAIMARIINLRSFMHVIRLRRNQPRQELQIMLLIRDSFIPDNNQLWNWTLTREMSWVEEAREAEVAAAEVSGGGDEVLELTIGELTEWLFGYSVPAAAVPYDENIQTLRGIFLDEVV